MIAYFSNVERKLRVILTTASQYVPEAISLPEAFGV